MNTAPPQGPQFQTTDTVTHWAVITWRGTHDLADTEFHEVVSADSQSSVYQLAHIWAQGNLAGDTRYKVQYAGCSPEMEDQRENDPRKNIPLSGAHTTTARQRANIEQAERMLAAHRADDHHACQEWCAVKS